MSAVEVEAPDDDLLAARQALSRAVAMVADADDEDNPTYHGGKIKFTGTGWAAYSDRWALGLARNPDIARHLRVMFAAMSRVNPRSGVAYFHEGELRSILGNGTPCSRQVVTDALATAKAKGLVRPTSNARKVWLDRRHVQRGESATWGHTPAEPMA